MAAQGAFGTDFYDRPNLAAQSPVQTELFFNDALQRSGFSYNLTLMDLVRMRFLECEDVKEDAESKSEPSLRQSHLSDTGPDVKEDAESKSEPSLRQSHLSPYIRG